MRALLRAELLGLANSWRHPEGRVAARARAITLGCTALGAGIVSTNVLTAEPVIELLDRDTRGILLRLLVGLWMAPALMLSLSMAMNQLGARLFRTTAPELALTAPVAPSAWLLVVSLRLGLTLLAFALVLVAPGLLHLFKERGLSLGALAAVPVVVMTLVGPAVALALALHVLLMRYLASPKLKAAVHALGGLAMVAFAIAAMLGFIGHDKHAAQLASLLDGWLADGAQLPLLLDLPARWALWFTGAPVVAPGLLVTLLLCATPILAALGLAPLYRRAYENSRVVGDPVFRALPRALGRRWPASVTGSVFRRECVRLAQQPSHLLGWLFVGGLVVLFQSSLGSRPVTEGATPVDIARLFPQLMAWLVALMTIGGISLPASAVEERPQRELLMLAPAPRRSLLTGVLLTNGLPYLWCLVVLMASSLWMTDVSPATLGWLLVTALPVGLAVVLLTTALALAASRAPTGNDGQLGVTHVLIVEFILIAVMALYFWGVLKLKHPLETAYLHQPAPDAWSGPSLALAGLAGVWLLSALIGVVSLVVARRGLERWLAPD